MMLWPKVFIPQILSLYPSKMSDDVELQIKKKVGKNETYIDNWMAWCQGMRKEH